MKQALKMKKLLFVFHLSSIDESSLTGKKPPEEIIVIAKLKELKYLKPKIFKIIKIENVIT